MIRAEGVENGASPTLRWEARQLPQVLVTGRAVTTAAFRIPYYRLPHHGLNYLACGLQQGLLNGRAHRLEGGMLHAFRAGDTYVGHAPGGAFDCRYATFTWPVVEGRGEAHLPRVVQVPARQAALIADLFDRLDGAHRASVPGAGLRATGLLLEVLGLMQNWAQPALPDMPAPLAAVLAHCEAHLQAPLTLRDLAQVAGWSADHLRRSFRRAMGTSVLQHLIQRRMQRARHLLAHEPAMPIRSVAQACGFPDPKHFARTIARWWGSSPRALRQAQGTLVPVPPPTPPRGSARAISSRDRGR